MLLGPASGRGRAHSAAATVIDTIRSTGHEPVDLTGADAGQSGEAVRVAVAAGAERIIVAGGDGLVHLALQHTAGTDTVLGVVPVGTGNDFARAFGVEESGLVEDATQRALASSVAVDAIHTDRGWIASVATAGFSGDVNARATRLRWPKGPKRYTVATLLEIPRLGARAVRLVIDGRAHDHEVALLAVANTAWFGGGMHICPAARSDDGLLDVTIVDDIGRLSLLRYFPRVFSGSHLTHPKTTTYRGQEVQLVCDDLEIWGDGEPLGPGPITFTATPAAINLAV